MARQHEGLLEEGKRGGKIVQCEELWSGAQDLSVQELCPGLVIPCARHPVARQSSPSPSRGRLPHIACLHPSRGDCSMSSQPSAESSPSERAVVVRARDWRLRGTSNFASSTDPQASSIPYRSSFRSIAWQMPTWPKSHSSVRYDRNDRTQRRDPGTSDGVPGAEMCCGDLVGGVHCPVGEAGVVRSPVG